MIIREDMVEEDRWCSWMS